jgi:hypothetical protein
MTRKKQGLKKKKEVTWPEEEEGGYMALFQP